jgi:hypothetical protein
MFFLFADKPFVGKVIFGLSLILMLGSLSLSFREILISVQALNLELSNMQDDR